MKYSQVMQKRRSRISRSNRSWRRLGIFERLEDRRLMAVFENFDGVTAPNLPADWTQTTTSTNPWTTVSGANSDSPANHAFAVNLPSVSDSRLTSLSFVLSAATPILTFRNAYDTESTWDGGVLEISINSGAFSDILVVGGSFLSGGYTGPLRSGTPNPLTGRQAWNGSSGGYITTSVNLPAAALGVNVVLRWRLGSDESVSGSGWRIDTISLNSPPTDDFGDAPTAYPVTLAENGARHTPGALFLGATIDTEPDGVHSQFADADGSDEDGVVFPTSALAGTLLSIPVTASIAGGFLNAWIDWNADGDWSDSGEKVFNDQVLAAGVNSLSLNIPAGATLGTTFARFRLGAASGLGVTGPSVDGEVEDYVLSIAAPGVWVDQGPAPTINGQLEPNTQPNRSIAGAIHTLLAHPTNPDIVYAGAINGGIWKTTNATALNPTWVPQTDFLGSLSIGVMAFDPTDASFSTIVAGTSRYSSFASVGGTRGNIFRTTDGGANWAQMTSTGIAGENLSGIAVRGNTIVVTSSTNVGGIFRSTNAGASFSPITSADFSSPADDFSDLVVDPTDGTGQRLYAASVGSGGKGGIYRSDNFGSTWTKITSAVIDAAMNSLLLSTNNIEMAVHPTTGRLYVGTLVSGQPRGLFYTNNGTAASPTWTQMDVPLLPVAAGVAITDASNATPIVITQSAHGLTTGNFVIVSGATGNSAANGFFRITRIDASNFSLDTSVGNGDYTGGGTYTRVTGANPNPKEIDKTGGQGRIHFSIVVDPTNENIVYVGGDRQEQPNTIGDDVFGGAIFRGNATIPRNPNVAPSPQWDHITHDIVAFDPAGGTANGTAPHADSREMAFDANGNLLETDDGGIYRRTSPRNNTGDWFSMAGSLGTFEIHSIAYDSLSNVLMSGNQDNGTHYQQVANGKVWDFLQGGDGGDVAVDNVTLAGSNQSIRYSSSQNLGGFTRSIWSAGNTLVSSSSPARTVISGAAFVPSFKTPVELNAVNPQRMLLIGGNGIYESTNSGTSITQISTVVSGFLQDAVDYGGFQGAVPNPDVFYAGMASNVLVRTAAAGVVTTTDPNPLSTSDIQDVVMRSDNWNTAYAIDGTNVYQSIDAGSVWTNITGNLMSLAGAAIQTVEYIAGSFGALVVGGNLGVFSMKLTTPGVWAEIGSNLPNALVFDLRYNATDDVLAVGTMGRGAWTLPNPSFLANVDTTPPKILDVKVGNPTWNSSFINFVDPSGTGFPIPDGASQNLALPWSNINRIFIQFSEDVGTSFSQSSILLTGVNVPNYTSLIVPGRVTFNSLTNVGTIELTASLGADKLRLTVFSTVVTDVAGNLLDGEWTDNVTIGASGNGTAGGNFAYRINVLPGDVDGSGAVLSNDVTAVVNKRLTTAGGLGYIAQADIDASSSVLSNDVTAVVNRRLTSLPAGNPPEAPIAPISSNLAVTGLVGSMPISSSSQVSLAVAPTPTSLVNRKRFRLESPMIGSYLPTGSEIVGPGLSITDEKNSVGSRRKAEFDAVMASFAIDIDFSPVSKIRSARTRR